MGADLAFDSEAHRGGRGLLPENTLPAFANAPDLLRQVAGEKAIALPSGTPVEP